MIVLIVNKLPEVGSKVLVGNKPFEKEIEITSTPIKAKWLQGGLYKFTCTKTLIDVYFQVEN